MLKTHSEDKLYLPFSGPNRPVHGFFDHIGCRANKISLLGNAPYNSL